MLMYIVISIMSYFIVQILVFSLTGLRKFLIIVAIDYGKNFPLN